MSPRASARVLRIATVALVATTWFGTAELVATNPLFLGHPAQVWIASGLALGIVTVTGLWAAAGVLLGASAYWLLRGAPVAISVLVALIDTAETVAAAYLFGRLTHVRQGMSRVNDVIGALAAALACTGVAAATVALVMHGIGGMPTTTSLAHAQAWWWSHFSGDAVLAPLVVVFAALGTRRLGGNRAELVCLVIAVLAVSAGVFDRRLAAVLPIVPHTYHLIPLLIWAGLRWDLRVGTAINTLVTGLACMAWMGGASPFATLSGLQAFIAVSAVTTLVTGALRSERILATIRVAAIHEGALDAIVTVAPDGRIVEYNPSAATLFGIRASDAIGREAATLLVPPALRREVRQAIVHYNRDGEEGSVTRRIRYPMLRNGSEEFPAEVALTVVRLCGEVWFNLCVRDITAERNAELARRDSREVLEHNVHERTLELIQANEELKRRDELLHQAQALANLGSFDFDVVTARLQWSDELAKVLGRDPSTLPPTYDGVLQCVHPADREHVRATLDLTLRTGQPFSFETRIIRPDDSIAVVHSQGRIVEDGRGSMLRIAGYCQDITDRVRAEEARNRLSHLVESSADAIIALSLDGTIETWNTAATRIFGYVPAEVVGKSASMLVPAELHDHLGNMLALVCRGQSLAHYELRHRRKDGSEFDASVAMSVILDDHGQTLGVSKVLRDITDQKAAEHRLWLSLREKEILLREIHHRVKNNLQVISSLLNLQLQRLSSAPARQALAESQSRIQSMALVHQLLYRSGDLAHINFLDYLKTVVDSLVRMYGSDVSHVDHTVDGDSVHLDIDRAIACGLIVTELVTNSLRHAFPDGGDGHHVAVHTERHGSDLWLEVRDDGIGLSEAAQSGEVPSFGLQIARTLAQQLDGALDLRVDHGTRISIRFPVGAHEDDHAACASA